MILNPVKLAINLNHHREFQGIRKLQSYESEKKNKKKGDKKITNSFIYPANVHLKALLMRNSKETTDFTAQRLPEEGDWADGRCD